MLLAKVVLTIFEIRTPDCVAFSTETPPSSAVNMIVVVGYLINMLLILKISLFISVGAYSLHWFTYRRYHTCDVH
jgi:hypothetical protein